MKAFSIALLTAVLAIHSGCLSGDDIIQTSTVVQDDVPNAQTNPSPHPSLVSLEMRLTTGEIGPHDKGEIVEVIGSTTGRGRIEMFFYADDRARELVLTSTTEIGSDTDPTELYSGFPRRNDITGEVVRRCSVQSRGVDGKIYETRWFSFN